MIFLQTLNLGGFGKSLTGGFGKGISLMFWGIMALVGVALISWIIYKWYSNVAFFRTPCSLTLLFENGTEKTNHNLRGGAFMNNGVRDFKIKIPKVRQPQILGYMPDFSKADGDGRLHFTTPADSDRSVWFQYEKKWQRKGIKTDEKGNQFEYDLISKAVPREIKQLTINTIKNWRETIDKKKLTIGAMVIGGFIIMAIAHLVSLYIQTKIRCPA